jgi:hypothetical protein
MEEEKIKCSNCKCNRIQSDFIGKLGNTVKRCLKCREKDGKRKALPENKNKTNKRQNDKKYYIKHREKKREENEEEYLKHNAEIAKNWRSQNKEHLAEWQTQNFAARFRGIKQQAQKKNIIWNDNMTDELCYNMMTSNCFYCGLLPQETLNGIDRLDSSKYYEINNCVSCCKICNYMKSCLDPITFVNQCEKITNYFKLDNHIEFLNKIPTCKNPLQHTKKEQIEKTKIIITKQQPKQEIIHKIYEEIQIDIKKREYEKGNNLPNNFEAKKIPKYCYYIPETDKRGDSFCIDKTHPKQNGKIWRTTSSKKVSIEEKYNQMMAYLNNEEYNVKQELELPKKEKSPPKPKTYSDEIYIEIFKLKHNTSEDASKIIKDKFQITVKRDIISKIWLGDIDIQENLKETPEYSQMKSLTKKRTKKATKFTEDELEWVKNVSEDTTLAESAKLFEDKFNKTITKAYISKVLKDK